jgi:phospholipid/cholesterol/gamma-HCH transport system permease protein
MAVSVASRAASVVRPVGAFYAFCLDTMRTMVKPPFQWREFVQQAWLVVRVSFVPAVLVSIAYCVFVIFYLNVILLELGAADLSGAAAGLAVVQNLGPIISVLVISGAGATAICADLGARTIREEIDAMRVLAIDPIQRLVVPRVVASTLLAVLLTAVVDVVGLVACFFTAVYLQHSSPGAFVANLTLLTGTTEVVFSVIKAVVFGVIAGLVACYLGLTVKGGPKGVGAAVNETVVYAFMILFFANVAISFVQFQIV